MCMSLGATVQAGASAYGAVRGVGDARDNATAACQSNRDLREALSYLERAVQEDVAAGMSEAMLAQAVARWEGAGIDLKQRAEMLRESFYHRFVVFLACLAVVSLLLFFAIDKKAGRLQKLFAKIGDITDAMERQQQASSRAHGGGGG